MIVPIPVIVIMATITLTTAMIIAVVTLILAIPMNDDSNLTLITIAKAIISVITLIVS